LIKRPLLIAALLAMCAVCSCRSAAAASTVDPTLVPFKKGELQQKLEGNKDNAHALILLVLRADEMSTSRVDPKFNKPNPNSYNLQALRKLDQMRRRYPNDMKVLSAYCFALDIRTQGASHEFTNYEQRSPEKEQKIQDTLKELRQKAPKLWVSYAIEGYRSFFDSEHTPEEQDQGIKMLKKAVELAPNVPLVHQRYGYLCRYAADWQKKPALYATAVKEYQKALQLSPPSANAALDLLYSNAAGWLPNGKPDIPKAKVAAHKFLSMLPKGYVFADYEHHALGVVGIKVP